MLIALIVEFHVDSIPIFNSLAYPQLKLLKKPTLSTTVLNGVACGGFHSVSKSKRPGELSPGLRVHASFM
jgi:hypothetical protein